MKEFNLSKEREITLGYLNDMRSDGRLPIEVSGWANQLYSWIKDEEEEE